MCIRDSDSRGDIYESADRDRQGRISEWFASGEHPESCAQSCLLYTSDAADERSSVDLGGRRFIKKKKQRISAECGSTIEETERKTVRRTN